MRLDRFLSSALFISRSDAKEYIKNKRVFIGKTLAKSPSEDVFGKEVFLDGKKIEEKKNIYLLLNKPKGYVSTTEKTEDSVLSLVPKEFLSKDLAPAGRLDKESEGLLILTDDGNFAHDIISPSKHLEKTYFTVCEKPLDFSDKEAFEKGIVLKDGTVCKPAKMKILENKNEAEIVISEGKYHQVRRMIASRDNKVIRLVRTKIGKYSLENIPVGKTKIFTPEERN